jgi:ABC-type amino acid transport system permease subunit
MDEKVPGPESGEMLLDEKARHRGRMGLTIAWENIPWWGIIVIIVGVFIAYSALTNTRYVDALRFIFDLPWNMEAIAKSDVAEDGSWSLSPASSLAPGTYKLVAHVLDSEGRLVEKSPVYDVEVPEGVGVRDTAPLPAPTDRTRRLNSSTPTIAGETTGGATVILYDDFSGEPLQVAKRLATANGFLLTIRVTIISFAGALILGLLFGLMRVADRSPDLMRRAHVRLLIGVPIIAALYFLAPSLQAIPHVFVMALVVEAIMFLLPALPYTVSTLYVEVVRGVPMLVIILYMGFAVTPALRNATGDNLDLRGLPAAVIGLAFGYGAYLAEVYRAGIQSIPHGQMEAARSMGMSYFQAMRHIILPQAIRVVLPPLGNDFIAMLKDSSLISVIALPEVLQSGRLWVSRNFRAFEGYNSVMLVYVITTLILSLLVRFIERKSALPGR